MDFNKLIQSIAWNRLKLVPSDSGQQQNVFQFNIWSEGATCILGHTGHVSQFWVSFLARFPEAG